MFSLAISICLLLPLALSGVDLFVSNISADEPSNLSVEKKS